MLLFRGHIDILLLLRVREPSTAGLKGASFQMLQADWFLLGCISSLPETYAFSSMLLDKHLELTI